MNKFKKIISVFLVLVILFFLFSLLNDYLLKPIKIKETTLAAKKVLATTSKEISEEPEKILETKEMKKEIEISDDEMIRELKPITSSFEYESGEIIGTIEFNGYQNSVRFGCLEEYLKDSATLYSGNYENLLLLGHNMKNGTLFYELTNVKVEDVVTISLLNEGTLIYDVTEIYWMPEEEYNKDNNACVIKNGKDLTLVTCKTKDGISGRIIVICEKR